MGTEHCSCNVILKFVFQMNAFKHIFISNLACSFSVTVSGGGHWGIAKTVKLQQNVPETMSKIVENRNRNARGGGEVVLKLSLGRGVPPGP